MRWIYVRDLSPKINVFFSPDATQPARLVLIVRGRQLDCAPQLANIHIDWDREMFTLGPMGLSALKLPVGTLL